MLSLICSGLSGRDDADNIIADGKDHGDHLIRECAHSDPSGFDITTRWKDQVVSYKNFCGIREVDIVLGNVRRAFGFVPRVGISGPGVS
jgi:hypothetical protein